MTPPRNAAEMREALRRIEPGSLADRVLNVVHGFPDDERRNEIRQLAVEVDAAIRERNDARSEASDLAIRCSLETERGLRESLAEARAEVERLRLRLAELEAAPIREAVARVEAFEAEVAARMEAMGKLGGG